MGCHHKPGGLQDLLNEVWGAPQTKLKASPEMPTDPEGGAASGLSPYQLGKKIEQVVKEHIRPMLEADGGGIEIVDIKDDLIYCRLMGACAGCPGAAITLKMMVERAFKDMVAERLKVIAV